MATESCSFTCCLCCREFLNASALKKRKLLHGKSCTTSKEILNNLTLQSFRLSLAAYRETADPTAVLCHVCDVQITKVFKLQDEIEKIRKSFEG